ncbi:MarR family winged helix-turn-helix transcriptional regulator [Oxalobacter paraformigenes]|uniref:HTH marR-type domain-containing protein n=1 Tax=Oxalobacter paraformigenes TaxID=556268 RepID=C3X6F4_9BURK|nr:MarR family winged helix-turn-helix transcriptional regulator [Oxalobacter paraformigenes]EEO28790.1 hypothetical protein OFAG_01943 [Oxalobacter paraformigenes]
MKDRLSSIAVAGGTQYLDILQKFRVIVRSAQKYSQKVEKILGVSGAQLWIMKEIDRKPGLRVGEIARLLAIHQTTASNLLDVLEKKNMVCKTRWPTDQRIVNLSLTQQGEALLLKAPELTRGLLPEALSQMEPEDLRRLGETLDVLLESISQVDEEFALQPLPFTM